MSIARWPEGERPREKLLAHGPAALSDSELLAIFLRTGMKGFSAVDIARQLIQDFGSLSNLLSTSQKDFEARRGLGSAKYAQLMASKELVRRALIEEMEQREIMSDPLTVRNYLRLAIGGRDIEVFVVVFLNIQNHVLAVEELFKGSVAEARVYPREIVRRCLEHNAVGVIVAHNHPSGVSEPSHSDRVLTNLLKAALDLVEVRLLDHFIVTGQYAESFAERGWL
ncbi:DNA repair protein RadC [Neisseriaceae bacterium TC5R-5]|nr:DNA repair protein RadC [Neisseriaceae bacterium TC5R-5]